jgi:hypothetical protein
MQITVDIPEELAKRLNLLQDKLPQILELGLRELDASSETGFSGIAEILEFLASLHNVETLHVTSLPSIKLCNFQKSYKSTAISPMTNNL